ncbi:DUF3786 domain-containing protein [Candidatus Magnetomonas plexicatena]|uniref:DUF3786 domain-containing protein n=1 Tax=Candidatus Magnetomonas plexicatena TaxID=2552947 RepID=UPI0011036872|nr:DUF3786 domain-containing protein [Nitrospirales bacterium LBB_01]
MVPSEDKCWATLNGLSVTDVCRRCGVSYDQSKEHYVVKSFAAEFSVSPKTRKIAPLSEQGKIVTERFSDFFTLSTLFYLNEAKDIPESGRIVSPLEIKGGDIFFRGGHTLPLNKLALKYDNKRDDFLNRGFSLGGELSTYGDVSLKVYPFPRLPVILILWHSDDEFPPRADLLLDSSCDFHLPTDVIWYVCMLCTLMMF